VSAGFVKLSFLPSAAVSETPTLVSAVAGDFVASVHLLSSALDTAALVSLSTAVVDSSTLDFAASLSLDFAAESLVVCNEVLAFNVRFL